MGGLKSVWIYLDGVNLLMALFLLLLIFVSALILGLAYISKEKELQKMRFRFKKMNAAYIKAMSENAKKDSTICILNLELDELKSADNELEEVKGEA